MPTGNGCLGVSNLNVITVGMEFCGLATAQTDIDAIMMEKNTFCVGPMYSYRSWKKLLGRMLGDKNENELNNINAYMK